MNKRQRKKLYLKKTGKNPPSGIALRGESYNKAVGLSNKTRRPYFKPEIIFAPKENAEAIVAKLREGKYSSEAAIIGEVTEEMPGRVVVTTEIGAETLLPPPGGELLPRIC